MAYFLCVIGMVCIIEAVPYMLFPRGMKRMVRIVEQTPERYLQVIGLLAALVGVCIVYCGRRLGG